MRGEGLVEQIQRLKDAFEIETGKEATRLYIPHDKFLELVGYFENMAKFKMKTPSSFAQVIGLDCYEVPAGEPMRVSGLPRAAGEG